MQNSLAFPSPKDVVDLNGATISFLHFKLVYLQKIQMQIENVSNQKFA